MSSCNRSLLGFIFAGNELAAQELAHRGFWDCVDKNIPARALEIRKTRSAAVLIEILRRNRRGALHESRNDFAPALVRESNDGDFGHCRMQRQAALDLDRRDIL